MRRIFLLRMGVFAGLLAAAACDLAPETSRGSAEFDATAPRARSGETIILGKDDVIRVSELTPAQYRRELTQISRQFERQAPYIVYFAPDQTEPDAEARTRLDAQAAWIISNPQVRVSVTGHADDLADPASNYELGKQRARAVVAYLVRRGIDRERLIALVSKGDRDLVADRDNQSRLNRRVETKVVEIFELRNNDDTEALQANLQGTPSAPAEPGTPGGIGTGSGSPSGGGTPSGGNPGGGSSGGGTGGGTSGGGSGSGSGGGGGDTKDTG